MEFRRKVLFYKDYYLSFFGKQSEKVKEKIDYVLFVVTVAERIPQKFFQHFRRNKWSIRNKNRSLEQYL